MKRSRRRFLAGLAVVGCCLAAAGEAPGDNAAATARQARADRELAARLSGHPTLAAAWGEAAGEKARRLALAGHTDWHVALAGADYYREAAAELGLADARPEEILPLVPGPVTRLVDPISIDKRLGFGPPPELDRFGRPRVLFNWASDAPTWQNYFFGIGPAGARLAEQLSEQLSRLARQRRW